MKQHYYEYIHQTHQKQTDYQQRQMELKDASREYSTLRQRSRLYLSDVLLSLGQRIRPVEYRVQGSGVQANDGALEVKAGGC